MKFRLTPIIAEPGFNPGTLTSTQNYCSLNFNWQKCIGCLSCIRLTGTKDIAAHKRQKPLPSWSLQYRNKTSKGWFWKERQNYDFMQITVYTENHKFQMQIMRNKNSQPLNNFSHWINIQINFLYSNNNKLENYRILIFI